MPQSIDVSPQLEPIHLRALPHFSREVGGRLIELGKCDHVELRISRHLAALEIPNPAGFENPGALLRFPGGARSVDSAIQSESFGIELKDGKPAKEAAVGVIDLIIINFRVIPDDPA